MTSAIGLAAACAAQNGQFNGEELAPDATPSPEREASADGTLPDDAQAEGFTLGDSLPTVETSPSTGCKSADDCDGDGYPSASDCDDHDATINPEAYDFPGDGVDNDCDGTKDNPVVNCAASGADPMQFGRSADLCPQRSKTKVGAVFDPLTKASFGSVTGGGATANTHPDAVKVITAFGNNKPRSGETLLGLQSGPFGAAKPREAKSFDSSSVPDACAVIPLNADDCKSLTNGSSPLFGKGAAVQDWAEIKLTIRIPSNVNAMLFDFAYFSTEFNEFWNSPFNDAFWAIVTSGKIKGANVAKDAAGKAITVNSGFFQLCPKPPGPSGLAKAAALANCVGVDGDAATKVFGSLKGTYFDGAGVGSTDDTVAGGLFGTSKYVYGGGSGWLTTKFGVDPGETVEVRFIVHDTGDGVLDSAAIVDNIRWEKSPPKVVTGETVRPPS